ncbi:hypothetical protein FKP32DRAFT_1054862 [Trametes sanguinea]|nr:hypothetical protein FKP32DRAFT_1054862 [Trametes sanguinea]
MSAFGRLAVRCPRHHLGRSSRLPSKLALCVLSRLARMRSVRCTGGFRHVGVSISHNFTVRYCRSSVSLSVAQQQSHTCPPPMQSEAKCYIRTRYAHGTISTSSRLLHPRPLLQFAVRAPTSAVRINQARASTSSWPVRVTSPPQLPLLASTRPFICVRFS